MLRSNPVVYGHASRLSSLDVPEDFVELTECLSPAIDRQLGYFGRGRFVAFHYEPRAEDVMWRDATSFGIATGKWSTFADQVQPLAELYDVNVGAAGQRADHVLLFDRVRLTPYFAPRASAEGFLAQQAALAVG